MSYQFLGVGRAQEEFHLKYLIGQHMRLLQILKNLSCSTRTVNYVLEAPWMGMGHLNRSTKTVRYV